MIHKDRRLRRHHTARAIHPKGWPNRAQDKLADLQSKMDDIRQAVNLVELLANDGAILDIGAFKEAVKLVRDHTSAKRGDDFYVNLKTCSFCDKEAVTYDFASTACALHRHAFIDGKLGENSCVSMVDHVFVNALRKLIIKSDGLDFKSLRADDI